MKRRVLTGGIWGPPLLIAAAVIGGLLALLLDAPETWAWLARLAVSAPIWIIALCIHRSRAAFKAKGRSGSRRL